MLSQLIINGRYTTFRKITLINPTAGRTVAFTTPYGTAQREVSNTRGSARTGYWKFSGFRRKGTLHRNPSPPQLQYTSNHSWAALSIGRRYGTSFAASTSTGLSKCIQPAQAEDGMGPPSSYTGSLVRPSDEGYPYYRYGMALFWMPPLQNVPQFDNWWWRR